MQRVKRIFTIYSSKDKKGRTGRAQYVDRCFEKITKEIIPLLCSSNSHILATHDCVSDSQYYARLLLRDKDYAPNGCYIDELKIGQKDEREMYYQIVRMDPNFLTATLKNVLSQYNVAELKDSVYFTATRDIIKTIDEDASPDFDMIHNSLKQIESALKKEVEDGTIEKKDSGPILFEINALRITAQRAQQQQQSLSENRLKL